MTVYVIAQMRFTDRHAYDRYARAFFDVFRHYQGTLLAADEQPRLLEGSSPWEKVVLLSFPTADAFRTWFESPDYQRISKDRTAGTESCVMLVQGVTAMGAKVTAPERGTQPSRRGAPT